MPLQVSEFILDKEIKKYQKGRHWFWVQSMFFVFGEGALAGFSNGPFGYRVMMSNSQSHKSGSDFFYSMMASMYGVKIFI